MGIENAQPAERRDGRSLVRRSFGVTTRALNEDERSFEVVASTDTIDSHGDIVEQNWDLNRYRKNPVVFWNHNNFESSRWSMGGACEPEDFLPIGRAENVRVEGGALVAKLILVKPDPGAEEEEELVNKIWRRVKQGVLRAVSVGFYPGTITEELAPGGTLLRLGECELLEISIVPIPSNPDAVAKAIAAEREQLARMASNQAANSGKEATMAMTPEEKAAFETATTEAKTAKERVSTIETELKAEKATSERLTGELATANAATKAAADQLIEQKIHALVGVKITPAEEADEVALAKELGLERSLARLAKRADLPLTAPVKVDGEPVSEKDKSAPKPVDGSAGDASADIVKSAQEAATRAA